MYGALSTLTRPILPQLRSRTILATSLHRAFVAFPSARMRVPYAPSEPQTEEARPVYERIAERRKPRPLIPLDLALLHNPAVADGWNSFIGAIRTKTSVPEGLRELAISRVAVLNKAVHEWDIHAALAVKAGISRDAMQLVFDLPVTKKGLVESNDTLGFAEDEYAVLSYTDQMTIGVEVEDAVAKKLKGFLSDKQIVELTTTIAAYNCVSRVLVALDVGENNGNDMKKVKDL
ncbi:4-carboxymuconolactone decarboxylase-like protein [Cucurbitaria berberidis CBS 394.84]|uniref:4-carboxymuconolactone decarboxylase-like protein n=1 Tax=Cucurbitaria berberidis CBS 394.84 TaxID=1168544 RepID=A0A9P4GPA6_9PLEO|nr:4-carboxymuconolactone decarboxylase-like protein [Cucurbitaria berberidis CBS 394.84]KAF1849089.1 4-carboxymuconolactone decarboxylase-like protein [Cucurbitaria berberidis CBS 394.84]